jgi:uncharacterized protein YbjQ (UPF0145 family)
LASWTTCSYERSCSINSQRSGPEIHRQTTDELRVKSTQSLKAKAHEIGANAIVAVDLDLSTVTIGGISMMMASGTAVVIE